MPADSMTAEVDAPERAPLESPPPRLNALGGRPAPPTLADDLRQLEALSDEACDHFWELLEPHLHGEVREELGELTERFGTAFQVPPESLLRLVRACRLLLRSAARADLPVSDVTIDLNVLCGETPAVVKHVTEWYREALPRIHSFEVMESLPAFGAVLEDVRVRKQLIPTSRHTPEIMTRLGTMTLGYLEDGQRKQLTLQVTPQMLALLQARCEELT